MHAILAVTVSWEDYTSVTVMLGNQLFQLIVAAVNWVIAYKAEVITFIGLTLTLCGMALGIRYLWQRHIQKVFERFVSWPTRKVYNKVVRNPVSWALRPFRRLHRRWSEKNLRATMAKWKKEIVAEIFYDSLSKACEEHLISKTHKRRLMKELAEFFDIAALKRTSIHPEAVKRRNEMVKARIKKESAIGPEGVIPGGKPGENTIPLYQGLGHKFLARRKQA